MWGAHEEREEQRETRESEATAQQERWEEEFGDYTVAKGELQRANEVV